MQLDTFYIIFLTGITHLGNTGEFSLKVQFGALVAYLSKKDLGLLW